VLVTTFGVMLFKHLTRPWVGDPQSLNAQRMRRVNERLTLGMTREQVAKVFAGDVARNPNDQVEDDSELIDPVDPPLPRQLTLAASDLPHFPGEFGTYWEVKAGFNKQGFLVAHKLESGKCCGL
jgi:hypothetical protein